MNARDVINRQRVARRKGRQRESAFAALVATPGDLTAGVALPLAAPLVVASDAELTDVTALLETSRGAVLHAPAGAAAARWPVGTQDAGVTITKHADAVGTVSVYVKAGLGRLLLIAEG